MASYPIPPCFFASPSLSFPSSLPSPLSFSCSSLCFHSLPPVPRAPGPFYVPFPARTSAFRLSAFYLPIPISPPLPSPVLPARILSLSRLPGSCFAVPQGPKPLPRRLGSG